MKKIKVLRVITRLNVGGPAIHAILLSSALNSQSVFSDTLVCGEASESEGNMVYLAAERGVRPVVISGLCREISFKKDAKALRDLYMVIKREKPDIIHTHMAKAGALGRIAAVLAGVPVKIHTFHGHVFDGYFSPSRARFFTFIERILALFTDRVITVSDRVRDDIINYVLLNLPDRGIGSSIAISYSPAEYQIHVMVQEGYSDTILTDMQHRRVFRRTADGVAEIPFEENVLADRKPISNYIEEFEDTHHDLEVVAILPHGNAMTLKGFIIFENGVLYHPIKEMEQPTAENKTYTCFVSWVSGEYSIANLEFRGNEVFMAGSTSPITRDINYAVSGQQLVKDNGAVNIADLYDKFTDPKQIFMYPHFKYKDAKGRDRDLFFGMAAMYQNKEMFKKVLDGDGYVEFDRSELELYGLNNDRAILDVYSGDKL